MTHESTGENNNVLSLKQTLVFIIVIIMLLFEKTSYVTYIVLKFAVQLT